MKNEKKELKQALLSYLEKAYQQILKEAHKDDIRELKKNKNLVKDFNPTINDILSDLDYILRN